MTSVIKSVEERWGMPFWLLVHEIFLQGFSRTDASRILGYEEPASFHELLRNNPRMHNFPLPDRRISWIQSVEDEYGQSIDQILAGEIKAAHITGTSLPILAEDLGCAHHQLYKLVRALGIQWPRNVSIRRRMADKTAAKHYKLAGFHDARTEGFA